MNWLVIAVVSCTVAFAARAHATPLADALHGCATGNRSDCGRLEDDLEMLFAGGSTGADRIVARELASAASRLIRDATSMSVEATSPAGSLVTRTLARCAADDTSACDRIANVLAGLFAGADARLDKSADRVLARAFAGRVLAIATDAKAPMIGARSSEARR